MARKRSSRQVGLLKWSYEAVDVNGKLIKGKVSAESYSDAVSAIEVNGLTPVKVTAVKQTARPFSGENSPAKMKVGSRATFARQLYMLVKSGLQLTKALSVLSDDAETGKQAEVFKELESDIISGMKFSAALRKHPRCFDDVFISYIVAGEETGDIQEALRMLSIQLKQQNELRLKVKSVTAYPKIMSFVILLIAIGILWKLVPVFEGIYADNGAELPLPTRMVVSVSNNLFLPLATIALFIAGFIFYLRKNADDLELRTRFERKKFRFPVLGPLAKDVVMHRWATTLSGALSSGLQMMPALVVSAGASGSFWIRLVTKEMVEGIRVGRTLSSEVRKNEELFDARTRAMTSSGEEAGEMADMFDSLGETIESEINAKVSVLGARLEVGLLVIMGIVVGTLLVALYLPIFGMVNAIGDGATGGYTE